MKEPTLGSAFLCLSPGMAQIVSLVPFGAPDIRDDPFVGKRNCSMSWAYLRQFPSLVWIVILGTFMVRTTFFMVWPFLSILLYRDYGLSATLIGLILGATAALSTLVSFYGGWFSGQRGGATSCCSAAWFPPPAWPCSASPTRWAGWHSGDRQRTLLRAHRLTGQGTDGRQSGRAQSP